MTQSPAAKSLGFTVWTAIAVGLLGVLLLCTSWGDFLVRASFDYSAFFHHQQVTNSVLLIEMDTSAYSDLHQTRGQPWDRSLHTKLLDQLTRDGNSLVIFDILFATSRGPEIDKEFQEAIKRHPGVVLLAGLAEPSRPGIVMSQALLPLESLRGPTTLWGIGQTEWDVDGVVRKIWEHTEIVKLPPTHSSMLTG